MYKYVGLSVGAHGAEARDVNAPEGGVRGSWDMIDEVSGGRTQVLCKATVCLTSEASV